MKETRTLSVIALVVGLGIPIISAQQGAHSPLTSVTDSTDLGSLTKADVMSLLQTSGAHPLPAPTKEMIEADSSPDMYKAKWKNCNGKSSKITDPWTYCQNLGAEQMRINSAHAPQAAVASFFRACSLSVHSDGTWTNSPYNVPACVALAKYLHSLQNDAAALAVVENAPGCVLPDPAGTPVNTCSVWAVNAGLYDNDFAKKMELTRVACQQYLITDACQKLSGMGVQSDLVAAQQHDAEVRQGLLDAQEEKREQDARNDAAARARDNQRTAVLNALQSMPGASPNSIQEVANRQEANMRATGDANAAAAQQAANARIAAQQTAASQQLAAQQAAAAQLTAQRQAAQQQATQSAPSPTSLPGGGCGLVTYLVKGSSEWRTGPAAMDHEVIATFTNNAAFPVSCTLHFHKNGVWDSKNASGFDLAPGSTTSGESGGLWTIGADSSDVQYVCYRKNATDTQGNTCSDLPW